MTLSGIFGKTRSVSKSFTFLKMKRSTCSDFSNFLFSALHVHVDHSMSMYVHEMITFWRHLTLFFFVLFSFSDEVKT